MTMQTELDIEQPGVLVNYLQNTRRIGRNEEPEVTILSGGVSNRTVLVKRASGEDWVIKQALAKLRVAADWYSSPERIHREAQGLRWLERLAPAGTITPFVFEDNERHILAMQAVPQPHENWKTLLLAGLIETEQVQQFGRLLGSVHRQSSERRSEIEPVFGDTSFFESLRLEPYYRYTASQVPESATFFGELISETQAQHLALVHGDYSPKNVLVYQRRLVLLDHEVIHFGDPAFDLGFSLAHFLSKAHHLPDRRLRFAEGARLYWESYRQETGSVSWMPGIEGRAVRHTLGCLLARVSGRSTLEYLTPSERSKQRQVVLELMGQAPSSIPTLIDLFSERIDDDERN
jgi:aminoglycoside phosphotransferase (APT) family kinase protein